MRGHIERPAAWLQLGRQSRNFDHLVRYVDLELLAVEIGNLVEQPRCARLPRASTRRGKCQW